MKKFIIMVTILWAGTSFAADSLISTSINNNYLGIGKPGIQQSEAEVNQHLQPMNLLVTINPEYSGPVFKDHKIQTEILNFLLREDGLKPFRIVDIPSFLFEKNHSKTDSKSLTMKKYEEQKVVWVFRNMKDYEETRKAKGWKEFKNIGTIDVFSEGKATEMDCLNQAIVDAGKMGATILLILKRDFVADVKSRTVGLGSSSASGLLHGGQGASVGGAAIGYTSSTARPRTNPYIHGIALYSDELTKH